MTFLDATTARALLLPVLMTAGLRSPTCLDGLDLDGLDLRLDGDGDLSLPRGFVAQLKRRRPHWFASAGTRYHDPDNLRRVVHPDYQLGNSASQALPRP